MRIVARLCALVSAIPALLRPPVVLEVVPAASDCESVHSHEHQPYTKAVLIEVEVVHLTAYISYAREPPCLCLRALYIETSPTLRHKNFN